jgi:hypothetical protein
MPTASTAAQPDQPKTYPPDLKTILERGQAGDLTVLPELKKAFDENPELSAMFGDLVLHAEQALLSLAAGNSLTAREAIARQVSELRNRLLATAASELEKLLVDRIVITWIEVYHGDMDFANHVDRQPATAATRAATKRLDRAHQRFLTAIKCLATVQKLLRPAPSQAEVVTRLNELEESKDCCTRVPRRRNAFAVNTAN